MAKEIRVQIFKKVKDAHMRREAIRSKASNYYIQEEIFERGRTIPVPLQQVEVPKPTIVVFADDAPLRNWAHPCRYLLHDAETGELYYEIHANLPPYVRRAETPESFYAFHIARSYTPVMKYPANIFNTVSFRYFHRGNRYAILFAGMSNNRHTNDLEFLYRTLINIYGYSAPNITVLNYDGTLDYDLGPHPVVNWPGDHTAYTMPVNGPGTRQALLDAMDALKPKLQPDDSLLIHTNNHGNGQPSLTESVIYCYSNWDTLNVTDFTNKLAELPQYNCLMVMMEQCFSGGFNNPILANSTAAHTSVASAADAYHTSAGGPEFDPFALEWIAAMTGHDPYGNVLAYNPDSNYNGVVSAVEAFNYAKANDPDDVDSYPVFNSSGGGSSCWLGQDVLWMQPLYYVLLKEMIFKHWPEPDPYKVQEIIRTMLPELAAINEAVKEERDRLIKNYEQTLIKLIEDFRT